MNPGSSHVSAHWIADRIIGSLLDSESPGLVLSIDIGGSLFDVIAKHAASSSLHQFVGCPSRMRYRSQLQARSLPAKCSDVLEEAVMLGRVDGIMRLQDDNETFEPGDEHFDEIATRSIDSWAAGRPALRLVHFGDPKLTLDQMAGATGSLAKYRPIATFYTAGLNRHALFSLLKDLDYSILDLSAGLVQIDAPKTLVDFGWIAVPSHRLVDAQAVLSDDMGAGSGEFSEWQEVMERNAPLRQLRSRAVFGLPANPPQLVHKFTAGDLVAEDDCYPVESDGITTWRWFGPRPRTRLALPCALPGVYQTEIVVIASHLQHGIGACRILVGGREVRATIHGAEQGTIRFVGQLDADDYAGFMTIDVVSLGPVASVGADPRALRLNVQSITVSPWR